MRSVGNNHAQFRGTTMRNFGEDLCVENSMFLDTVVKILGHMCPLRAWCNA